MFKISITGHRDLKDPKEMQKSIGCFFDFLKATGHTDLCAVSSIAAGADTLFAEEADKKGIPLEIVLPFQLSSYKQDFTEKDDLEKLNVLLKKHAYKEAKQLHTTNAEERNQAYLTTGLSLAKDADCVLAVWDGKPANGTGGTGDIADYCIKNGKQLYTIKAERMQTDASIMNEADVLFKSHDDKAKHCKKWKLWPAWLTGVLAGLAAAICFAIAQVFVEPEHRFVLSCCEVAFVLSSYFAFQIAKKSKKTFLDNRRSAEYLRTIIWYQDAEIAIPAIDIDDSVFSPNKEILDMESKIRAAMVPTANLGNIRWHVWHLANSQAQYHQENRAELFERKNSIMEHILFLVKLFFIEAITVVLVMEFLEKYHLSVFDYTTTMMPIMVFTCLVLPPVYAALEASKSFGEWKRNITISRGMVIKLDNIKTAIENNCPDFNEFNKLAKQLRDTLELENNEWALRIKDLEIESKPG